MRLFYLIIGLFLLQLSISCSDQKNEVIVYTSVDQIFSEPILKDFEQETGINVKAVFDTEETKSTGVLNRLLAEKEHPQCDLFWSGDPIRTMVLKEKGITTAYQSRIAEDIATVFKDSGFHWTGFSARARVLIYNKNIMKTADIPQSIFDLTKEKYKGKIAIANPLFGTTTFHIAALFSAIGEVKTKRFLEDLKKNKVVIATSNGDVKKRVSQGEVYCGLTDTDDAFEAIKEGAPIGIVFLNQDNLGSLIMPNTLNLINKSPNLSNAQKLFDYLISKETEAKLAVSCAQMPLHKGVKIPKGVPSLDYIIPMKIDYKQTAKELQRIQTYLKEWVEK